MKNILLISYLYPPTTSSQAEHVKNLGNYLSDYYNVSILTTSWIGKVKDINLNEKLTVHNTSFGLLHRIKNNDVRIYNTKRKKGIKSKVVAYIKGRMIPDPTFDWYFVARRWLKKNVGKYDVIISIATPYTDLLIGNKFLKMHRNLQKPKFIACYADPWYGEISRKRSHMRKYVEKKIENSILKNVDHILMVTKNAKEYYEKIFPQYSRKMNYYYIGHNVNFSKLKSNSCTDIITFRYFGALQSVHRNPFIFLDAIDNKEFINKITLELYLIPDPSHEKIYERVEKSETLKKIVKIKIPVPYAKMLEIASSKGINILFGNTSNLQIPVKMFDYIGVKSEILYIENKVNEEITNILNAYKTCTICDNTFDSIDNAIHTIVANYYNKNTTRPSEEVYYKTCSNTNFNIYKELIDN